MSDMLTLDGYEINEVQLFGGGPADAADVLLVRRRQQDGKSLWAITDHSACLSKDGQWELEPQPSSRDDDFKQRCRYSTPEEALAIWRGLKHPTRFYRYYPEFFTDAEFAKWKEVKPAKRIAFTFDDRSRITEDEAQEAAEIAGLKLPKLPLCTCGYGGGPSPAHRGDCPMRVWE